VLVLEKFEVAIVIPAFNESNTITQVIKSASRYGIVIVVNDSSTDDTKEKAIRAGAIVVSHSRNRGYDVALNTGFKEADSRNCFAIITFDADGQHPPHMLKTYIDQLVVNQIDLVLGFRPCTARFSEWVFQYYTKIKYHWNDPLCGMKGYSMKMYRDKGLFDSCNSIGTELALFGITNKYRHCEISLPIAKRLDRPRFSSTIKSNFLIFRALYNLINISKNNFL
jgi:glycosyltransferase involved in cell wall biosynthesis